MTVNDPVALALLRVEQGWHLAPVGAAQDDAVILAAEVKRLAGLLNTPLQRARQRRRRRRKGESRGDGGDPLPVVHENRRSIAVTHHLKCWSSSFIETISNRKPYEVRVNDRDFALGDVIVLWEWFPDQCATSGRRTSALILSITEGRWGLPPGLCVLGFSSEALAKCVTFAVDEARSLGWKVVER